MKRNRKLEPGYQKTLAAARVKGKHARRYGISSELYLQRMDQACFCGVCGDRFSDSPTLSKVYDHDHRTNQFRGVIHRMCNAGLGIFNDDASMLRSAAEYLERFK